MLCTSLRTWIQCDTASQKVSLVMSREVSSRRYLLYSLRCSFSSHIFLQSMSPLSRDVFSLYFNDVRYSCIRTAWWSLSAPSSTTWQFFTCLWSVVEQTISSSMCELGRPVLVGLLLVHVPYPGPLSLHSKKVFVTQRRCARYSVSSPLPFAFRFEKPCGPRVGRYSLDCRSSSLPMLALTAEEGIEGVKEVGIDVVGTGFGTWMVDRCKCESKVFTSLLATNLFS